MAFAAMRGNGEEVENLEEFLALPETKALIERCKNWKIVEVVEDPNKPNKVLRQFP